MYGKYRAFLFGALLSLISAFCPAYAAGTRYALLDMGLGYGTKPGIVLGLKYTVMNDLAVGLDVFALPATPGGTLGLELNATYFPPIIGDYASIETGMSFSSAFGEVVLDGDFVSRESWAWALNTRICGNSPVFLLGPMFQDEEESEVPTVVYLKIGAARVLASRTTIDDTIVSSGAAWRFPCVELGLRQGTL